MCGEQAIYVCRWVRDEGSPPRVRGTASGTDVFGWPGRITPACAGNSAECSGPSCWRGDHPRVCGEQARLALYPKGCRGSPPRVRGTDNYASILYAADRITPACAGNSAACRAGGMAAEDHPRVCGEQGGDRGAGCVHQGSPPRVRGTEREYELKTAMDRITPACAGNRLIFRGGAYPLRDHPRVCGEQLESILMHLNNWGSPPRVRGTDRWLRRTLEARRITPACAGNRSSWTPSGTKNQDHPRVCGEQAVLVFREIAMSGSPPRVRGTDPC